jgi:hypothetical protein
MTIVQMLMAARGVRVLLPTSINRSSTKATPTNAAAGFRLHSDGTIDATPDSSVTLSYTDDLGPWLLSGAASDYEARIGNGSPDAFSGQTSNVWHLLSTTREWYAQVTTDAEGGGIQDSAATLEIRDAVTLVVLASSSIDMYAEVVG